MQILWHNTFALISPTRLAHIEALHDNYILYGPCPQTVILNPKNVEGAVNERL